MPVSSSIPAMERHDFSNGELRLSYLDSEGTGNVLIVLHGHWMEAATFRPLADCLPSGWRLVALDQRGHGDSDHASSYERSDYLSDLEAFFKHLGIEQAVLLGHSLGGVNAYQFAALHPEKVQALVIEDIGPIVTGDVSFVHDWSGIFPTRKELEERVGPRLAPYVKESFRHNESGWQLAFEPSDEEDSQRNLNGDHWADWLASDCDALVIRGEHSPITKQAEIASMVARRPNTTLVTLPGGHVVHADSPKEFCQTIDSFLLEFTGYIVRD